MSINLLRFRGKLGQTEKWCPGCQQNHPLDDFWSDPSHSDGLFTYCKTFEVARRRKVRQEQRQARELIEQAGIECAQAARDWDAAVLALTSAWGRMLAADETMRLNRRMAGTEFDGGRMELRILHPRAMYVLGVSLQEAKCFWPAPLHRVEDMPMSLAAYVGDDPQRDYFSAETAGDGSNDVSQGRSEASEQRAEAGSDEQGDGGSARDGDGRVGQGRRGRVPGKAGEGKRARIPRTGGEVSAEGREAVGGT